jgi:hypothetical protein
MNTDDLKNETPADAKPVLAEVLFTKEQVIAIVAQFGRKYDTGRFCGGLSLEEAKKEVADCIEWDVEHFC